MAPYILGNHVHVVSPQEKISGGKVTATYIDEGGKPTGDVGEAKVFNSRSDVDRYVVQQDIEVNVIIVKENNNGSM